MKPHLFLPYTLMFSAVLAPIGTHLLAESPDPSSLIRVEVESLAQSSSYSETYTWIGRVEAVQQSSLGFDQTGTLEAAWVEEGERVEKGQLLARIDRSRLESQKERAVARVEEAGARLQLAETTLKRTEELYRQQIISSQEMDEVRQQRDVANAILVSARADVLTTQIRLNEAELRAPFSGTISKRWKDAGDIVTPGAPVLELLSTDDLRVRVGIPLSIHSSFTPNQHIQAGGVSMQYQRTVPVRRTQSRTADVLFEIEKAPDTLLVGDFVEVPFERSFEAEGFWIPRTSLTETRRGLWGVYVVRQEDSAAPFRAERRQVSILHIQEDKVYVQGALSEGEQVMVAGLHKITPGQQVAVAKGSAR